MTHLCFPVTNGLGWAPEHIRAAGSTLLCSWLGGECPSPFFLLGALSFLLSGPLAPQLLLGVLAGWPSWPLHLPGSVLIWMQAKLPSSHLEESFQGSPVYPEPTSCGHHGVCSLPASCSGSHSCSHELPGEGSPLPLPIRWWPHLAKGLKASSLRHRQTLGRNGRRGGDREALCLLSPRSLLSLKLYEAHLE